MTFNTHDQSRRLPGIVATICLACGCSAAAQAQETTPQFTLFVGGDYSDNFDRQPEDGQAELAAELGATVAVNRESPNLSLRLDGEGSFRTYTRDTFDDEFLGGLSGAANVRFVPERFEWIVEDDFGQAQTDIRQVQTAANRGDYNRFSTGPAITLPLGSVNALQFNARYTDLYYEERDDDYSEVAGDLGFLRPLSANRSVGLIVSASDVEYDLESARDAQIRGVFFRLQSRAARSELELDVGYNEVESDFVEGSGELLRARFMRELSPRVTMNLSLMRHFATSGDSLRIYRSLPDADLDDPVLLDDLNRPAEVTSVGVGFDYQTERTGFAVSASLNNEESEVLGIASERDRLSFGASWSRSLSRYLSVGLVAGYDEDEFDDEPDAIERTQYGANLTWTLSRKVDLQFGVYQYEGDGGATRPTFDYEETTARLRIVYIPR